MSVTEARIYTKQESRRIAFSSEWEEAKKEGLAAVPEKGKCVIKVTEAGKGSTWMFFQNGHQVKKFYIGNLNDSFKQALRLVKKFLS
jgi:hypothetical protein